MSNFVLPASAGPVKSFVGWENSLVNAIVTGSAIDSEYAQQNLFDHNPRTEFSTSSFSGNQEVIFTFAGATELDYFGFMSKNGASSSAVVKLQYLNPNSGSYDDLCETSFERDGQPYSYFFGNDFSEGKVTTNAVKVILNSSSKLFVIAINCGLSQSFKNHPEINFRPARLNPKNKVIESKTLANMPIASYVVEGGYVESAEYDWLDMESVKHWLPDLQKHMYAKKFLFYSHNTSKPLQSIYGVQTIKKIPKPKYTRSIFTSVSFEFDCFA